MKPQNPFSAMAALPLLATVPLALAQAEAPKAEPVAVVHVVGHYDNAVGTSNAASQRCHPRRPVGKPSSAAHRRTAGIRARHDRHPA